MKWISSLIAVWCLAIVAVSPVSAQETERIKSFTSQITINQDASIRVTEEIVVEARGIDIKRGIYRDIPTLYKEPYGFVVKKPITVLNVTKNGSKEPHRMVNQGIYTRIYIGEENVFLDPGTYIYVITYETDHQLGYFERYDELYWNVTGNGWSFLIDSASADIAFPPGVQVDTVHVVGYTGPESSTVQDVTLTTPVMGEDGLVHLKVFANNPLGKQDGLTIAANWPKGFVVQPSATQARQNFILNNLRSLMSVGLFLVAALFYFFLWLRVGRDRGGAHVVVVQYGPPDGMTPAQVRFVDRMGEFDTQCIAADLVHMAVNGYITIHEEKKRFFVRRTQKSPVDLVAEEKIIYERMFPQTAEQEDREITAEDVGKALQPLMKHVPGGIGAKLRQAVEHFKLPEDSKDQFVFKRSNHTKISKLIDGVKEYFAHVDQSMFVHNRSYLFVGVAMFILLLAGNALGLVLENRTENLFFILFAAFWNGVVSIFVYTALTQLISGIREKNNSALLAGVGLSIFLIPFIGVGSFVLFMALDLFGAISAIGLFIILFVSFIALKRRTPEARLIQDHIEGFRLFLSKAQQRYIERTHPDLPSRFSMYERFLPFAIALNVEPQWSAQFKSTIAQMAASGMQTDPGWYASSSHHFYAAGAVSAFSAGALSSALGSSIASASVNPSSSSGSSGGGSSGGGGGGGGGGGW